MAIPQKYLDQAIAKHGLVGKDENDDPAAVDCFNGGAHVYGLARNGVLQGAGTYNTTEVLGIQVIAPGSGNWTVDWVGGPALAAIPPAAFTAGQVYPIHAESITVGTGGNAILYIPDA